MNLHNRASLLCLDRSWSDVNVMCCPTYQAGKYDVCVVVALLVRRLTSLLWSHGSIAVHYVGMLKKVQIKFTTSPSSLFLRLVRPSAGAQQPKSDCAVSLSSDSRSLAPSWCERVAFVLPSSALAQTAHQLLRAHSFLFSAASDLIRVSVFAPTPI